MHDHSLTPETDNALAAAGLHGATAGPGGRILSIDLHGVDPDRVAFELDGGDLVIRGAQARGAAPEGERVTAFAAFEHRLALPAGIDVTDVRSWMENERLQIALPAAPAVEAGEKVPLAA